MDKFNLLRFATQLKFPVIRGVRAKIESMKAVDIFKAIENNFEPQFKENGFNLYKGKSFLRVVDEVVQLIKVSCHKYDVHIWYACYPLCEKNIWFGAATNSTSGRLPEEGDGLKITDAESLDKALYILVSIISDILAYFNKRSSISLLEMSIPKNDLIVPGLIKGYCLSKLGSYDEASHYLKNVIKSELSDTFKEGAVELFEAIGNNNADGVLELNALANIKKLGLKRYI
jgi:hypothetical protein